MPKQYLQKHKWVNPDKAPAWAKPGAFVWYNSEDGRDGLGYLVDPPTTDYEQWANINWVIVPKTLRGVDVWEYRSTHQHCDLCASWGDVSAV